jgi:transposase|uniref:IS110 family transposase n=1 Tax=Dyadobacter sp. MSC1_007 TaxID=2909264 RepID=UPI00202E8FCB|nr:transposase [Dyadobacter sp. MSC1_007]
MRPELFIGIDISKVTLDISVVNSNGDQLAAYKIANTETSITDILEVITSNHKVTRDNSCFCAEDMGLFASFLSKMLAARKYKICFESSLRIKKSIGIQRGKNDAIDALRIARYACNNFNSLHFRTIPRQCIADLKGLTAVRKRLLKTRKLLSQSKKMEDYYLHEESDLICTKLYANTLTAIKEDLTTVERKILKVIEADEQLARMIRIITSVPRIGKVTAVQIVIATNEFQWIACPKKFASYCGVAPFQLKSGTSLNSRAKVSGLANRELKSLIHMAAIGYAKKSRTDFLAKYYRRKIEEGKRPMSVLNAVRNKLIHRIFSCIKTGTTFVDI